ncbi:S-adenosyl-L-methionine-dependent methyltransferase [Pavlovales sp. CCMP2436]|nr:S-adenosyl-L-methionine-dependent methyltransferase [Pavlovales sp. CCMP2436]
MLHRQRSACFTGHTARALTLLLVALIPAALPAALPAAVSRRAFGAACATSAFCLLRPRRASAAGASQYSTAEDLLAYVQKYAVRGNVSSVIAAIDSFSSPENENKIDGWGRWMMNVGPAKGEIYENLIRQYQPTSVLEVGTFCGYSALRTIRALPADATFVTIEKDPRTAAVASAMFEFAGVPAGRINLVIGALNERFAEIQRQFKQPFDFVLFDHWKPEYAPDLKRLEQRRMLRKGTVLVADNVICPGAPSLLADLGVTPWPGWDLECDENFLETRAQRREVYESRAWSTRLIEVPFEYRPDQPDAMSVSVRK